MFIKSSNKICIQYNYLIKIQEQTFNKLIFKYKKTTLFKNVVFYFLDIFSIKSYNTHLPFYHFRIYPLPLP